MRTLKMFPPPWTTRERPDGLANVYCGETPIALCVREDVAAVMIAAPAMLAALKLARDAWHVPDDGLEGAELTAYDTVCAAIDSAEGR